MSAKKKRINLTVDDETYKMLKALSKKKKQKPCTVSLKLIQQALDLEEDMYFSKEADRLLSEKHKTIDHIKLSTLTL